MVFDNIKEIIVVGLAVAAIIAVVALSVFTFGAEAVIIAAAVGAAAGLASQLITDIVSGFVTGKFKVSSPLNYISSAVGTALSLVLAKGFDGFTTKFNKGLKNTGFKITERFAGSHSYRADYSRSIKRLIHGNSSLKNITYRTYRNGFVAEFTENIFINPTNGALGVGWDEIKELVFN